MPKAVAKRALSPTLSSDSSLSSAPDITDIAIEDTTTPISLDQKGTKALVEETAVDITVSNKRRRIGDAKETKPPPKRTRRETVNRASHKEATEEERDGEEEVKKATKFLEKTSQKRSRRIKASTNGLKHAAVKTENKGEIEVISRGTTRGIKKSTKVKVEALSEGELSLETPKGSRKKAKAAIKAQEEKPELSPEKPRRSRKGEKAETEVQDETQEVDDSPKKPKKKRKTKEEKEAEAMPLAVRTTGLKVYIGAHVSSAKGLFAILSCTIRVCPNVGGPRLRQISPQECKILLQIACTLGKHSITFVLELYAAYTCKAATHSPYSSNPNGSGRTRPYKTRIRPNSELSAQITSTTLRGVYHPIHPIQTRPLTHTTQSRPSPRLLPRQPGARRPRQSGPSIHRLHRRPPPLRSPGHQTLQLPVSNPTPPRPSSTPPLIHPALN